jgi:hypothetical protein
MTEPQPVPLDYASSTSLRVEPDRHVRAVIGAACGAAYGGILAFVALAQGFVNSGGVVLGWVISSPTGLFLNFFPALLVTPVLWSGIAWLATTPHQSPRPRVGFRIAIGLHYVALPLVPLVNAVTGGWDERTALFGPFDAAGIFVYAVGQVLLWYCWATSRRPPANPLPEPRA